MARPRVIVADTDESYVIPLQKKFAELFADKIDLEIITDKDYFNQLFSLSQHADILLVSDTLYNSGLKKHDIRHLMILSEHYEPGQTDELDICRLFKYTSVREIFNEITGRCKETLYAEQDAGKETKIILITSASGGVGKTSVAFGLCRCLERNYKKTLYVNADRLQSFQWMLVCRGILAMFIGSYGMSYERKVSVIFRRLKRRLCRWVSHTACLHY